MYSGEQSSNHQVYTVLPYPNRAVLQQLLQICSGLVRHPIDLAKKSVLVIAKTKDVGHIIRNYYTYSIYINIVYVMM